MIIMQQLSKLFAEKLLATNSMDAALKKACWVAYKQGLSDAKQGSYGLKFKASRKVCSLAKIAKSYKFATLTFKNLHHGANGANGALVLREKQLAKLNELELKNHQKAAPFAPNAPFGANGAVAKVTDIAPRHPPPPLGGVVVVQSHGANFGANVVQLAKIYELTVEDSKWLNTPRRGIWWEKNTHAQN